MKTTMSSDTKLTNDEECESVDSTKYRGMIDYVEQRSTSGSCMFVEMLLTSLVLKIQTARAISLPKPNTYGTEKAMSTSTMDETKVFSACYDVRSMTFHSMCGQ
ncbi:hypothetical protein Tco_1371268 [Tanacetum coccineum]